jgi:pilus assembly protein CpaC
MHLTRKLRRLIPPALMLTLAFGLLTTSTRGQPPDVKTPAEKLDFVRTGKLGEKVLTVGRSARLDLPLTTELPLDVLVEREDVLRVTLPTKFSKENPGYPVLTGLTPGITKLTFSMRDGTKLVFTVVVEMDIEYLRYVIRKTVPTANVDVQPGFGVNTVVLSGYVTSPQDGDIVARLANSAVGGTANNVINAIQIGGVQQVQIDVVVASVDRTALRNRGFDFTIPGDKGQVAFASLVSGLLGTQSPTVAPTFNATGNLQLAVTPNKFFAALQALRTENLAKFLAEPKVVTQSGRTAFFRAGGQQAILSGTSGITGPGVQLVPFGTELEVVPIVYGNGMIWLDINPRITAVSQGLGITVNGAASPGFTEQSIRSTVLLESGQTFAIGGLIQNSVQASANKVPVLGDLPFVGIGFSSISYQVRETELIILVTPHLVHPLDQCQTPKRLPGQETRNPDDYELFLENILEAPRGQRKVWNGKCYNAAYKCDPTVGKFPCAGNVCTGANGSSLPAPGAVNGAINGGIPGASGAKPNGGAPDALPGALGPMPGPEVPSGLPPFPGGPAPIGSAGSTEPVILPPSPPAFPAPGKSPAP